MPDLPPSSEITPDNDSGSLAEPNHSAVNDAEENEKRGCVRACGGCLTSLIRFLGHCLLIGCGFQLVVGTLLRLTIKDTIPHLSLFFYASPPILLALAAFVLCVRQWIMKEQRRAIILLMVSLVMTGWWHWGNYNSSAPQVVTNNETSYQVLFWNVSYAKAGWPALIEEIQKYDADIIGMVEVGHGFRAEQDWLKDAFPDYQIQFLGHGFVLIRGDILSHKRGFLENHGGYGVVRARLNDGEELGIVLADIYAYPFMPRGPAFEALSKVLENETDQPVCLMGDFNTPPDSVFFNPLRETLEHSFEVAGNGYQVTWPIPVPVLCLDQIWLPEGGTRSAEYHTSPHSDHRLVVAQWLIPRAE